MARARRRIKKPSKGKSKLSVQDEPNYDDMPPVFSLERIQNSKYCFSKLDQNNQAAFANAIYRRREITWKQIKQEARHGLGYEKIATSSIKTAIPRFITDDIKNLLAFRFSGMNPMVGYRQKNIFYVLWFDLDFTLYNH